MTTYNKLSAALGDNDEFILQVGPAGVEDGTFPATVTAVDPIRVPIKDDSGTVVEERDLISVTFALDDGREVEGVASPKLGSENSKLRQWLNALLGRDTAGMRLTRRDIIGRECLVEVVRDRHGFGRVAAVLARPDGGADALE